MNDWVKKLAENISTEVPEGWGTTRDIANQLNISADAAFNRLNRLEHSGEVEKKLICLNGQRLAIWRPRQ